MSFNCSCSTRNPSWPNGESISWYALPGIMACRLRISAGVKMMSVADGDRVTAVARMTSAKKKPKATGVAEGQMSLDLGAIDGGDERIDIGAADEALEDLMDE